MRKVLIAAASALALFSGPVIAQTSSGPAGVPPRTNPPGMTGAVAPAPVPAHNPLTEEDVAKIKGTNVYGTDGKKIGDVSTALMKPESKTIDRLVVHSGGVLGVGGHQAALPLSEFQWDADKGGFKVAKTADDLKAMPAWQDPSSMGSTGSSQPPAGILPPAGPARSGSSSQ
jgi:sporulation protein YlmC with PRC-barrel domain